MTEPVETALRAALDTVLRSYARYYTVERDAPLPPFAAQAEFSAHGEQYFLLKRAVYAEIDAREFVYFALEEAPGPERLRELAALAWEDGMRKVRPSSSHRNSDVLLIILAGSLSPEAAAALRQLRYYRSYRFGLQGWSHFKTVAYEPQGGTLACNRQGRDLAKLIRNIFQPRDRKEGNKAK